jgi:hypothetical protein
MLRRNGYRSTNPRLAIRSSKVVPNRYTVYDWGTGSSRTDDTALITDGGEYLAVSVSDNPGGFALGRETVTVVPWPEQQRSGSSGS